MSVETQASHVKALRDMTGAGFMDCKQALVESAGDLEKAKDFLRKKGLASAEKRSGREAKEGIIFLNVELQAAAMLELNCETDFVARTEEFQKLGHAILAKVKSQGESCLQSADLEAQIKEASGKIGEKIAPRRAVKCQADKGFIASYRHHNQKIGILVEFQVEDMQKASDPQVTQTAKDIAMQTAALRPRFLSPNEVSADFLEREKAIFREQVKDKPANVQDKIIQGKLEKRFEEICLLNQKSVVESTKSISDILKELSKKIGTQITIKRFWRFEIGAD